MTRQPIHRYASGQGLSPDVDDLAEEEPLEIQVDTRPIAVTMRTPGHDEDLALGFLVTEGLLQNPAQVQKIQSYPRNPAGNSLGVFLASDVVVNFAQLTRHVFGSSSCGVCGKASIAAVQRQFPSVADQAFFIRPEQLFAGTVQMRAAQDVFAVTGGLHAAALFSADGSLRLLREDVGRHNAIDKIIGHAFQKGWLPLRSHVLMVSGRSSFEIQQKALAAGIACVAAVGAPSSLAVAFARETGQTLIGFLRTGRFNVYAGVERIALPPEI